MALQLFGGLCVGTVRRRQTARESDEAEKQDDPNDEMCRAVGPGV